MAPRRPLDFSRNFESTTSLKVRISFFDFSIFHVFNLLVFRSSVPVLDCEDVEVDADNFPVLMTGEDQKIRYDYAGNPKLMFDRHFEYVDIRGKTKTNTVCARESNRQGGQRFKTNFLEKLRK